MMPIPQNLGYPLSEEHWKEEEFDVTDVTIRTKEIINTYIKQTIEGWKYLNLKDISLWDDFRDSFQGWTTEIFQEGSKLAKTELRTHLRSHGVWVRKAVGVSYDRVLTDILENDERHEWSEAEIQEQLESEEGFQSRWNPRTAATRVTIEEIRAVLQPTPQRSPTPQSQTVRTENRSLGTENENLRPTIEGNQTQRTTTPQLPPLQQQSQLPARPIREETVRPTTQAYEHFNQTPHPAVRPNLNRTMEGEPQFQGPYMQNQGMYERPRQDLYTQRNPSRLLADLMKIYTKDDQKYGGEEYDILDVKLQIFYDCCTKVGLPEDQFYLAFSVMLKGRASSFYFDKISGRAYDFAKMVEIVKMHFETEERRQKYLTEWRETTLPRTMAKHPDKSQPECLEILFDLLRTTQRGLSLEYQNEYNLRDQVINACRGVYECRQALFRPSPTFEGICADLRSAIGQFAREKEIRDTSAFHQEDYGFDKTEKYDQNWTDRTYSGRGRYPRKLNPSGRGNNRGSGSFKPRTSGFGNQKSTPYESSFSRKGSQDKKCYVCKKTGCWSTNHPEDERKKAYGQFHVSTGGSEEDFGQFLQSFEGLSSQEDNQWTQSLEIDDTYDENLSEGEMFYTSLTSVKGIDILSQLDNQAFVHAVTKVDNFARVEEETSVFTFEDRYSSEVFQGIMPDSGASGVSTAGEPQFKALQRQDPNVTLDRTKGKDHKIRFGKGSASALGVTEVTTPLGRISFFIVPLNTPFLFCIQDMDKMGVRLDNLKNVLVQGTKIVPIVRKWGHPWMLLNKAEETIAFCHLTETELRQLHRRFGHPSVRRLTKVLQRAGYDKVDLRTIEHLTKFCDQCQLHSKSPGRFKFTLKDDYNFNFAVVIDIMYLDGRPVIHVVDEATSFNAARFLKDMSAKTVWDTVRTCWIDTYQGPPDYFVHDAGTNFASYEFRQNARTMSIGIKEVPVEAHNSIGKVERYHAPLRRAYEILTEELNNDKTGKEAILQMAVKAVNDTAGPDGLVPTLLVFGAYPRISDDGPPSPEIAKRAEAIRTAMKELRQINAKRQVQDALVMRNGPTTAETLNLPLQSLVRVWREKKGWKGPYRLIAINNETCTIEMPYGPTDFRTTAVKPFYKEEGPKEQLEPEPKPTVTQPTRRTTLTRTPNIQPTPTAKTLPVARTTASPPRTTYPVVEIPMRQHFVHSQGIYLDDIEDVEEQFITAVREGIDVSHVFITKKEQDDVSLSRDLRRKGLITTPGEPFQASIKQEIDALIANDVFEFVTYDAEIHQGRIFNSRLVNEVKGKATESPYEKSRLVIQAYNDAGKGVILTQSPTIQRASQRIIVALAPSLVREGIHLFLRDITQAYVQSTTFLNRQILAHLPKEIRNEFPQNTIMIVRKPLYGIPEAGTHWWATYYKHHRDKLLMSTSTYDPCLLITRTKGAFGVVGMQTDDTLILGNDSFKQLEKDELEKAKLKAKPTETLSADTPLMFNGCILQKEDDTMLLLQKGQGTKLSLVDLASDDRKEKYREQRARGAYIATVCQPEAAFDLSVAAQHQDPSDEEVKALNKRLTWQMQNMNRGIRYIPLDLPRTKLFVFVDGSFANNKDMSSQIGYEIILANESSSEDSMFEIDGNLIHYSSTKSKRVTRSVLASEIYGMVGGVDMAIAINTTIKMITNQLSFPPTPIVVCTDSFSLYECLVKLGTTKEKRLMIDIMAIRQSYERRELTEIRWINGQDNPADAMTKGTPNKALEKFIDTNHLVVRVEGWVKREN